MSKSRRLTQLWKLKRRRGIRSSAEGVAKGGGRPDVEEPFQWRVKGKDGTDVLESVGDRDHGAQ